MAADLKPHRLPTTVARILADPRNGLGDKFDPKRTYGLIRDDKVSGRVEAGWVVELTDLSGDASGPYTLVSIETAKLPKG